MLLSNCPIDELRPALTARGTLILRFCSTDWRPFGEILGIVGGSESELRLHLECLEHAYLVLVREGTGSFPEYLSNRGRFFGPGFPFDQPRELVLF